MRGKRLSKLRQAKYTAETISLSKEIAKASIELMNELIELTGNKPSENAIKITVKDLMNASKIRQTLALKRYMNH